MFEPVDALIIGEAVQKVLSGEDNYDKDDISLFEVLKVYKEINEIVKQEENELKEVYVVQSANSIFSISISNVCVDVYRGVKRITSDFRLISFCSDNNEFYVKCKYVNVSERVKGYEQAFFEKLFVKISDCPPWMQEYLEMTRQDQIKEIKKQRWIKILRRIFRFSKKI